MNLSPRKALLLCLLLSLFMVHAPALWLIGTTEWEGAKREIPIAEQRPVMVELIAPKQLPLADIAPPKNQAVPAIPSAQALYNSTVARETTGPGGKHAGPQARSRVQPLQQVEQQRLQQELKRKQQPVADAKPPAKKSSPPTPTLSRSPPKSLKDELLALKSAEQNREHESLKRFDNGARKDPVFTTTGFTVGGDDFLPSYKVGNRTYVNAIANPNVAYYVQLKRKFKLTWNPVPSLARQMHQISRGKIETVWGVSVDQRGKMADLVLIRGSGFASYDAEARRTIDVSAPFTSPPAKLLAKDGQVHMAWTFVVYL